MRPSPFFKGVIVALILLVLIAIGILDNAVYGAEVKTEYRVAPVVTQPDADGFMEQIGWYRYEAREDALVLYCIPESATTLVCAVFVETPKGNAVVLVDGIKATEVQS